MQGIASTCVFRHSTPGTAFSVHGVDFTAVVPKPEVDWFEGEFRRHYELTVGGRLGPGPTDDKEATVLNQINRGTEHGIEYEAGPRQVERLLEELELEGDGVKGVVTPGVKVQSYQVLSGTELPESQHSRFRGLSASANFLAADQSM